MEEAELPVPDFKLPPARELDADDREGLMRKAIARIREGAHYKNVKEARQGES